MRILSLVHGEGARAGVFGEVAVARGHELEEWSFAWGTPPPRPLDAYDAVLVLGGAMHADQEDVHPWLVEEVGLLRRLLATGTPVFGICLGAQLLARAGGGRVLPAREREIGFHDVSTLDAAATDPVFRVLPPRFAAYQWHYYTVELPDGAVEAARSAVCTQAFRLGDRVWAVQFHPEVTRSGVEVWMELAPEELPLPAAELHADLVARIDAWNTTGRALAGAFLDAAARVVGTPSRAVA